MKTRVLDTRSRNRAAHIAAAASILRRGGLVAFPTETVYGLGASVFHTPAIRRIFRVKGRPPDNPLIVHVWSKDIVWNLVDSIPLMFWTLADRFWPGPLTLVLRRSSVVPDIVTAGLSTVAIRVPDHPVARALLREASVPVVAPSANLSGKPSPTTAQHVREDLDGTIPAILDGGRCRVGVESTVLDLTKKHPVILRPGGITCEQIEEALGISVRHARPTSLRPASPGMKYAHYAPAAELIIFEGPKRNVLHTMKLAAAKMTKLGRRVGIMVPRGTEARFRDYTIFLLGSSPAQAAQRLFAGFRTLDRQKVDVILCPGFDEREIGRALMNRLRKAAGRRIRL